MLKIREPIIPEEDRIEGRIYKYYIHDNKFTIYAISSHGEVYNTKTNKYLTTTADERRGGYLSVKVYIEGKRHRIAVHRLVALTFNVIILGEHRDHVNHKDGDKLNNYYKNLEWVTLQENNQHSTEHLILRGEKHPNAIYSDDTIHEACRMFVAGAHVDEVVDKLGMNKRAAYNIKYGHSRQDIVSQYKMPESNQSKRKQVRLKIKNILDENNGLTYDELCAYLTEEELEGNDALVRYMLHCVRYKKGLFRPKEEECYYTC